MAASTGAADETRFWFFGGKGGVGKTTCAAATAVSLAEKGARVAVVSTDPAHSLGDALAIRLTSKARRVETRRGHLDALELDADKALARWMGSRRAAFRTIASRGTYLDDEDIDRLFALSLPGVDELVGLVELARIAREGSYDRIVVDTAPTGHTLRLLAMPKTLHRVADILDGMQAKHRVLAESLGGSRRRDLTDAVIHDIAGEAENLEAILRSPTRARFDWVLLPEVMAFEETCDGVRELELLGVSVPRMVVNRTTPAPEHPCPECTPRVRAEEMVLAEVRARFGDREVVAVPAEAHEPRGVPALRRVAKHLAARRGETAVSKARLTRKAARPSTASTPVRRPVTWLDDVAPPECRLLFFGGKGGVGKTTCASAAAVLLSEKRRNDRVLLLSTDPAHSLADALGVPLGDDERRVPGVRGQLWAREMDATAAFGRERDRYRDAVDDLFASLVRGSRFDVMYDRAVMQDLIDLAPPGLDELYAVLSLVDALFGRGGENGPAYDLVVVDTAPTGHTLRLLAMPAAALEWVHALLAILLKYRQVMGLGELATDLVALAKRLRRFQELLVPKKVREEAARFVVVTRAAELPVLETERTLATLRRMKITVPALVLNALTVGTCARCRQATRDEARSLVKRGVLPPRTPANGESSAPPLSPPSRSAGGNTRAMLLAPASYPAPRGVPALRAWGRAWEDRGRR